MYRTSIFLIFFICISPQSIAQWKAIYYEPLIRDLHYDITTDNSLDSVNIDAFYHFEGKFTGYNMLSETLPVSEAQNKNICLGVQNKLFIKYFQTPIVFKQDTSCIEIQLHQKGIKNYVIMLHDLNKNKWIKRIIPCPYEGYQERILLFLSDFQSGLSDILLDKLYIIPSHSDNSSVHASTLKIFDQQNIEIEYEHPFIDRLFEKKINYLLTPKSEQKINSNDFILFSPERRYGEKSISNDFIMKYKGNDPINAEINILKKFIDIIIDEYLFYDEHKINIDSLKTNWQKIKQGQNENLRSFSNKLASFIQTQFKDSHFYLHSYKTDNQTKRSPVRLYPIRKKIIVAGIFDSTYIKNLPLGSEILSIDNTDVYQLIEYYQEKEIGLPHVRKIKAINKLIGKSYRDSTTLTFREPNSDSIKHTTLYHNGEIIIPQNFRKPHCFFEKKDSISYFKINEFEEFTFLRFINHLKDISNSKGVIFDLRGNGGGDSGIGCQILSLFAKHPTVFHHTNILYDDLNRKESTVIIPDKQFQFNEEIPIVILGDEFTACASEDFILTLKSMHSRTFFVSHSITSGALQGRFGVNFPSGNYLSLDCLSGKITAKTRVIEATGIEPDIWIQPGHYKDLAPYNDLLLLSAFKLIHNLYR